MIGSDFIHESSLQYRIKALQRELESFKTGEKYVKMKETHRRETGELRREIKRLKEELARARKDTHDAVSMWFETCEDIINDENKEVTRAKRQTEAMRQKYFEAEIRHHDEKASLVEEYERKLSEKEAVIEELKNRLAHADALLNRDGTNTGLPTDVTHIRWQGRISSVQSLLNRPALLNKNGHGTPPIPSHNRMNPLVHLDASSCNK